jgi:PBP1b-binding outer membrane lipoprotein LpoB
MKMSILILLTAFFCAGCEEQQTAALAKPVKTAKRPAPTPTPGFRAVEKPESYSQ